MWKVTAVRRNAFAGRFVDEGQVAIAWPDDHPAGSNRGLLVQRYEAAYPALTPRQVQVAAYQGWRFACVMGEGDGVVTYDSASRRYHVGTVAGPATLNRLAQPELPMMHAVTWEGAVSRDVLTAATRNTLGAILTIFKLSSAAEREVLDKLNSNGVSSDTLDPVPSETDEGIDPFFDIAEQAIERIKDRILALQWDEVQDLVAALLRALGYRTMVSPAGSDRGRDILASRDGFGFEAPRVVVEVKHRRGAMGAPDVRAFLGGRHPADRGLYVSTGGFSREAQYEAERATTATHLMTLDGLARALVEQYEKLDERGRALLPLTRVYWPQ